jgi:hypothetical protein
MNNSTIFTADRTTHLKVVVVALIASIAVVIVGISARGTDTNTAREQINVPIKVGPSMLAERPSTTEIR